MPINVPPALRLGLGAAAVALAGLLGDAPAAFAADAPERYSAHERRVYETRRVERRVAVEEEPYEERVVIRRRFVRELEPTFYHRDHVGRRAGLVFEEPYGWAEDDEEAW